MRARVPPSCEVLIDVALPIPDPAPVIRKTLSLNVRVIADADLTYDVEMRPRSQWKL